MNLLLALDEKYLLPCKILLDFFFASVSDELQLLLWQIYAEKALWSMLYYAAEQTNLSDIWRGCDRVCCLCLSRKKRLSVSSVHCKGCENYTLYYNDGRYKTF